MQPPDADDLSHITQQPRESARKLWNKFLTKRNQIVDYPDAEALAAFKHNIRDEWLARHLGQNKARTMAALTNLMTRFCAGEDSWLARCSTSDPVHPKLGMEMGNHDAEKISAGIRKMARIVRRSTPDSKALGKIRKSRPQG